jgi:hypothetical protein
MPAFFLSVLALTIHCSHGTPFSIDDESFLLNFYVIPRLTPATPITQHHTGTAVQVPGSANQYTALNIPASAIDGAPYNSALDLYDILLANRKQIEMTTPVCKKKLSRMNETTFEPGAVFSAVQRGGIKRLRDPHHAGFGPSTVEKYRELWEKVGGTEIGKLMKMK